MADRALILGINRYKSVSQLRGCVNDAHEMARLLPEAFGFAADQVKVLIDDEVTKKAVKSHVANWLFADAQPGDRLALHFSGHGSYVADLDREEDERGTDELICLYDMDFARKGSYLTDDELYTLLGKAPKGTYLTVFLDNCNSGTGTKLLIPSEKTMGSQAYPRLIEADTAARVARSLSGKGVVTAGIELARTVLDPPPEARVVARFVEPPPEIVAAVASQGSRREIHRKQPKVLNHVLLSACLDQQTAADAYIEGDYHGAFTYYLGKILRESGRQLDRHELVTRLARAMQSSGFSQVPQLEPAGVSGPLFTAMHPAESGRTEPEVPTPPIPTPTPEPPPLTSPLPATGGLRSGEAADLFREFLRTSNRLIDLIQAPGLPELAAPAPRVVGVKQLVYVHGIGAHPRGFSDSWWAAMRPFTPSLWPGTLGGNRHEAYWSDLVNRVRSLEAGMEVTEAETEAQELADELRAVIADRIEQQKTVAAAAAQATGREEEAARGLLGPDDEAELAIGRGLDMFLGIDDFARYLTNPDLREQIIDRFRQTVLPLLQAGDTVEIIAHSWGTVVAYEALRRLDREASALAGSIHNFFTVGSALSIPQIKSRLLPEARDGHKPRLVRDWLNLDAQGDPVGGWLRGRPFQDDREFPNLPAVGCGNILWILPNPVCAHSSYFEAGNVAVNRDIFGRYIEGT